MFHPGGQVLTQGLQTSARSDRHPSALYALRGRAHMAARLDPLSLSRVAAAGLKPTCRRRNSSNVPTQNTICGVVLHNDRVDHVDALNAAKHRLRPTIRPMRRPVTRLVSAFAATLTAVLTLLVTLACGPELVQASHFRCTPPPFTHSSCAATVLKKNTFGRIAPT